MYPPAPTRGLVSEPPISERLCALEVLADAGLWGCTATTLRAYGFAMTMLANLVRDGLATARRETFRVGNRQIGAARIFITARGRSVLERTIEGSDS